MLNTAEVARIARSLSDDGHALTSFEAMGLPAWDSLGADVAATVERTDQFREVEKDGRGGMLMFRDAASLDAGRLLVAPIFEALFAGDVAARDSFGMYCVNHYELGHLFKARQDYFDGTVVIVTTSGERRFSVYEKDEDDVFVDVAASYVLRAGSILLLNGFRNLGHAAECTQGPSVSVVADVASAVAA